MDVSNYENGKDPLEKMGIGMKDNTVKKWLDEHDIAPAEIESELVDGYKVFYVDVDGDVILKGYHINDIGKIPSYIKFRNVSGSFILTNNNK